MGILNKIARGGSNTKKTGRRSNRPRGEGRGLIPTVRAIFKR